MSIDAAKARKLESEFLSGVEANLSAARGSQLRGSIWKRAQYDEQDRLAALLAENRVYDRDLLRQLPANRRIALHGFERRLWFWKRRTGVAIASVLCPLRQIVLTRQAGEPVGLPELLEHVRRLVGDTKLPHVIGVCSPSGFSDDAKKARLEIPDAVVVLVEPNPGGGWRVCPLGENVDPRLVEIFDPESAKQKVERVRGIIEEHSADLLTGGVSVETLAQRAHLPADVVLRGVQQAAGEDRELRLAREDGEHILYRGAPITGEERRSMNVIDRIKQLFSSSGQEAAKINLLAERRAALARRRDRIYDDIGKLEQKESELFEQGKNAKSAVPRRRIAAQLAQLRKDIGRQNATASMLNQQLNIISTDIHNLTLLQQGQVAQLPDSAELTEHAVSAEEMLETLRADADMVGGLETGMGASLVSTEEQAILAEFEQADRAAATPPAPAKIAARKEPGTLPAKERATQRSAEEAIMDEFEAGDQKGKSTRDRARGAEPT